METTVRKPFQGLTNIVRFNWHVYMVAIGLAAILYLLNYWIGPEHKTLINFLVSLIIFFLVLSLAVSYFVYDYSDLYEFQWLNLIDKHPSSKIFNIHAGFDETSSILKNHFPGSELIVYDFYDPKKHTEVSIKRARKAYPPYPGTISTSTNQFPEGMISARLIFLIFSLHEIRDRKERIRFLAALHETLTSDGTCVVMEHLRDIPNAIAYNVGFFHFYPSSEWRLNFTQVGFIIEKEIKQTPFITVFFLRRQNGHSL